MSSPQPVPGDTIWNVRSANRYRVSRTIPIATFPAPRTSLAFGLSMGAIDSARGFADASVESRPPVGVVTRVEHHSTALHPIVQSPSSHTKFECSICQRRVSCLCQACAAHKAQFYSKRSRQEELIKGKEEYAHDISEILKQKIAVEVESQKTTESRANLRQRIEQKRKLIQEKKKCLKEVDANIAKLRKSKSDLQSWFALHERAFSKKTSSQEAELEKVQTRLYSRQAELGVQLFRYVFPICEHESKRRDSSNEDSENTRRIRRQIAEASNTSDGPGRWTLIVAPDTETPLPQTTIKFELCGCYVNDCSNYGLTSWLKSSLPANRCARGQHSAFAALNYAVELVSVLRVFFDVFLPYQLSLLDIALCEKWPEGLFDTDVFKLNLAVVLLCLSRGLDASNLEFRRPFANLLLLDETLKSGDCHRVMPPNMISKDLADKIEEDLKKIEWAERERIQVAEDDWCLLQDGDDDFTDESPSSAWARSTSEPRGLGEGSSAGGILSTLDRQSMRQRSAAPTGVGRRLSDMFSSTVGGLFSSHG